MPNWLFKVLVPVMFLAGCALCLRPAWSLVERAYIRQVKTSDLSHFPVIARLPDSSYCWSKLGDPVNNSVFVTNDFPEDAINRDLAVQAGWQNGYKYFHVLNHDAHTTSLSLEIPRRADGKYQAWYEVTDGRIVPKKVMVYGPGFAFTIIPPMALCGLAVAFIFAKLVRRTEKRGEPHRMQAGV